MEKAFIAALNLHRSLQGGLDIGINILGNLDSGPRDHF